MPVLLCCDVLFAFHLFCWGWGGNGVVDAAFLCRASPTSCWHCGYFVSHDGVLFGGGAEYHISKKLAISAEVRYTLVKTWVQASDVHHVDPDEQDKIHLNSLVLSLGIRYFF